MQRAEEYISKDMERQSDHDVIIPDIVDLLSTGAQEKSFKNKWIGALLGMAGEGLAALVVSENCLGGIFRGL